jgi:hypothetical protein
MAKGTKRRFSPVLRSMVEEEWELFCMQEVEKSGFGISHRIGATSGYQGSWLRLATLVINFLATMKSVKRS